MKHKDSRFPIHRLEFIRKRKDRKFLVHLSEFIRRHKEGFQDAGQLLDERFSAEALREIGVRQASELTARYEGQAEHLAHEGRLLPDQESMIDMEVLHGLAHGPKNVLRKQRLRSLRLTMEREKVGIANRDKNIDYVADRMQRAIEWAISASFPPHDFSYPPPATTVERKAMCLLAWFLFEPVYEIKPPLCEFQQLTGLILYDFRVFSRRVELKVGEIPPLLVAAVRRVFPLVKLSFVEEAAGGKPRKRRQVKPGRPKAYDPEKDRKVLKAWKTRKYKTFAMLGNALGMSPEDAERAVDRQRKREKQG